MTQNDDLFLFLQKEVIVVVNIFYSLQTIRFFDVSVLNAGLNWSNYPIEDAFARYFLF